LELRLDVAGGHAAGIHGQDFLIEALHPCLAFFDQLWLKGALPISRDLDLNVSLLSFHGFLTGAVACVAIGIALALVFGIAQMRIEFGFQATLDHRLGELLEQAVLGQHVLRVGVVL